MEKLNKIFCSAQNRNNRKEWGLTMIRGVSRQIIEVQETGSAYYEKAYLIVNPEFSGAERQLLEREARKVIKSMGAPSGMKKARRVWHWVWRLGASAAIGAGLMALCIYLF